MSHGQEHSTWSSEDVDQDLKAKITEISVLLNSAAEAGNWNLVRELISNEHGIVVTIQQSRLLEKLASLTKISYHFVKDILKQIFSNKESNQELKVLANNVVVEAAKCGNWDTLIVFLSSVEGLLQDESRLLSVILTIASSQTLRKKRFLHIDVLSAVWRHSKQKILDSTDKTVQNTLAQLAAELNMWSRVYDLLVAKPDLNLIDRDGLSVFHRLVMCPDRRFDSLLSVLLEKDANVNLKTAKGDTALHLAAKYQKLRKVKYVLRIANEHGDRDYLRARKKYRIKHAESKYKALELLIKYSRNVNDQDRAGNTAAILAASNENWQFLKLLLRHGANVNLLDSHQRSLLHVLALQRSSYLSETLVTECIQNGAQVNRGDENGRSPLHLAVDSLNWTLCKQLIDSGANHEIRDRDNSNVLHRLALADSKHIEEVMSLFSLLKSTGANINAVGPSGNTVVHLAARQKNWTLLERLLGLGACINHHNQEGFTVLHVLASDHLLEADQTKVLSILDLLLEKGADLSLCSSRGDTALHLAVNHENWVIVKYLVQRGLITDNFWIIQELIQCENETHEAYLLFSLLYETEFLTSVRNPSGDSLLQLAAKHEKWDIVEHILKYEGGNVNELESESRSVLHRMASSRGKAFKTGQSCRKVLSVLWKSSTLDKHEVFSLIHRAAAAGNIDVVDMLLNNFDEVNRLDSDRFTVLQRVAQCCVSTPEAVIQRLVEKGADVNKQCPYGNTALHLAAKSNNWLAVQTLLRYETTARILDNEGMTVLHRFLSWPNPPSVVCSQNFPDNHLINIFKNDALINQGDREGYTPLHLAVKIGLSDNILELLITRGADVHARDPEGNTPLQLAAKHGNMDMVERLLEFQDNVNETDSEGFTLLSRIAQTSSPRCQDIVRRLLEKDADVNITCPGSTTPLLISVNSSNWPMTSCLFNAGAHIERLCSFDQILHRLMQSITSDNISIILLLMGRILEENEDAIFHRNSKGQSVMQLAFMKRQWDILCELRWYDVYLEAEALVGRDVFEYLADWAIRSDDPDWICDLLQNTERTFNLINLRNRSGNTPLNVLAKDNNWYYVKLFVNCGADVNMPDIEGWLPLHRLHMAKSEDNDCFLEIWDLLHEYTKLDNWNIPNSGASIRSLDRPVRTTSTSRAHDLFVCVFNARSVRNKSTRISNFIKEKQLDIMFLNETWLKIQGDELVHDDLTPDGYCMKSRPRPTRAGGVAVLWRQNILCQVVTSLPFSTTSYEVIQFTLTDPELLHFFCIYRPPPSQSNKNAVFFEEFPKLLEWCKELPGKVILLGDFNFRYDTRSHSSSMCSLVSSYGFVQAVEDPTHKSHHIIDWVLHRPAEGILQSCSVTDRLRSDHFAILCFLNVPSPR